MSELKALEKEKWVNIEACNPLMSASLLVMLTVLNRSMAAAFSSGISA
jgi:hypothetical protein